MLSASSSSSRDNADEFEEAVFVVELQGLFDTETIEHHVKQGRCRVGALDSDQPVVQIGSNLFVGRWETTPGTDLLFREIPHRQMLSFIGSSEKRLVVQRVLLNSKRKRGLQEEDDEEEADDGPGDSDGGGEQDAPREQEQGPTDGEEVGVAEDHTSEVISGDPQ